MKNLYKDIVKNWDDIKNVGKFVIYGGVFMGTLFYLANNLDKEMRTESKNVSRSSFEQTVLKAAKDKKNVKVHGIFQYVDIDGDTKSDAVIYPAPVRGGCAEIQKLNF